MIDVQLPTKGAIMSTNMSSLTVSMDENLKKEFQAVLDSMGLNMSAGVTLFAKAVVQRQELPFKIVGVKDAAEYEDLLYKQYVREKLAEAKARAADPDAKWYTAEEAWKELGWKK